MKAETATEAVKEVIPDEIGTAVTATETVNPMEELVEVKLFKDKDKYKDDLFVCVNGTRFLIQRGVTVKVPKYVKEVLDNAERQNSEADSKISDLSNDYTKDNMKKNNIE